MYSAPSGPNLASIQLCSWLSAAPDWMMLRTSSPKAGRPWSLIRFGSMVTATRLLEFDSSPMNHLFSQ